MRNTLEKSVTYGVILEVMYLSKNGQISKRKVKVLQVGEISFRAYCFLRNSKRTFLIDNVLAAVPTIRRERVIV